MWERVRAHNSVVTAAVFAPKPQLYLYLFHELQKKNFLLQNISTNSSSTKNFSPWNFSISEASSATVMDSSKIRNKY